MISSTNNRTIRRFNAARPEHPPGLSKRDCFNRLAFFCSMSSGDTTCDLSRTSA
jgi:hypothetical protein